MGDPNRKRRAVAARLAYMFVLCGVAATSLAGWSAWGAERFIGVAMSEAPLRINDVVTGAGATIFPGTLIETLESPARLRMTTGDMVYLAPRTRARLFAEHARIESGAVVLNAKGSYVLLARSLQIAPEGSTLEQVRLDGNHVQVSVSNGAASVRNASNLTVGRVLSSQSLQFTAGSDARSTTVKGRVRQEGGRELLSDETSGLNFRLQGEKVSGLTGRRVELSGNLSADADGAELLAVNRMAPLDGMGAGAQAGGAAIIPAALTIVIEEGDNAVNDIQQRVTREVIVRVEDENHHPVSEAAVTMLLPRSGATGIFSTGGRVVNLVTDDAGRVKASFTPENSGQFTIQITATKGGRKAEYLLSETNQILSAGAAAGSAGAAGAAGSAGASAGGISGTSVVLIGGVVVASVAAPIAAIVRNTVEGGATSSIVLSAEP